MQVDNLPMTENQYDEAFEHFKDHVHQIKDLRVSESPWWHMDIPCSMQVSAQALV